MEPAKRRRFQAGEQRHLGSVTGSGFLGDEWRDEEDAGWLKTDGRLEMRQESAQERSAGIRMPLGSVGPAQFHRVPTALCCLKSSDFKQVSPQAGPLTASELEIPGLRALTSTKGRGCG